MCFKHTLSKSKVRTPQTESEQDFQASATVKQYHYRPRGTRTSPLVNKPRKKRDNMAAH